MSGMSSFLPQSFHVVVVKGGEEGMEMLMIASHLSHGTKESRSQHYRQLNDQH